MSASSVQYKRGHGTSSGAKVLPLQELRLEVNHVTSVVKFSMNKSTLSRKRVEWFHLERIFESPTLDTFCGKATILSEGGGKSLPPTCSYDSSEDSDIDGNVEDMENLMASSFSLRPTVSEIDDLAERMSLKPPPLKPPPPPSSMLSSTPAPTLGAGPQTSTTTSSSTTTTTSSSTSAANSYCSSAAFLTWSDDHSESR